MGSYTFKWEHPAEEVFVTGTFDNWTKSEQLEKHGDVFQKSVGLKDTSQKIYFKFVVDGTWTVNESAAKEADHEGNVNNFITPADIIKADPVGAFINTVTPESTTAKMASEQPVEKREDAPTPSDVPGGFPETPLNEAEKIVGVNPLPAAVGAVNPVTLEPGEKVPDVGTESVTDNVKLDKESYEKSDALPGGAPAEEQTFGVNPLPAAAGALNPVTLEPGEKVPDVGTESVTDNVKLDKESYEKSDALPGDAAPAEEQTFGVSPLPATVGALNPIKLEPGEKVPDVAAATIHDHVKLDKESYEKSDALPGLESIDLPPITGNLIPESSLPVVDAKDVNINTIGTDATTLGLAAKVPLETKAPEIVTESQEKAGVAPEASVVPEEVEEKAKVEEELKEKVTEVPSTSEGTAGVGTEKSETSNTDTIVATTAAAAVAAGGAVAAAVIAAKDNLVEKAAPAVDDATTTAADVANKNLPDTVKENLPEPVQQVLAGQETAAKEEVREEVSPEVPAEVKESITESGKSPEAAANTTAVEEKKEVEAQLLDEVKPKPAKDEVKTETQDKVAPIAADVAPSTTAAAVGTDVSNVEVTKTEVPLDVPVSEDAKATTTETGIKSESGAPQIPPIDTVNTTTEVPKSDIPAVDTPVTETDRTEVAGTETPAVETSKTDAADATNGSNGAKASEASPSEKKKKNRISTFLSKLKHKLTE